MLLATQTSTTTSTGRGYLRSLKNNITVKRHFAKAKLKKNNRYYFHAKISEREFKRIVLFFSRDFTATQIAERTGLSRITINKVLMEIRERIAEYGEEKVIIPQDFAQAQENNLKQVLGIQVKGNQVQVEYVSNCCMEIFAGLYLKRKNTREIIFKYRLNKYTALVDINKKRYAPTNNRMQGFRECEKFWNTVRNKIAIYKGIRQEVFYLHMKECELRHNLQCPKILNKMLMQMIKDKPLASFYTNPN